MENQFFLVCFQLRSFVYVLLSDIDECSLKTDDCSDLANCINTDGSYLCECIAGYTGEGGSCTGNKHLPLENKYDDRNNLSQTLMAIKPREQHQFGLRLNDQVNNK